MPLTLPIQRVLANLVNGYPRNAYVGIHYVLLAHMFSVSCALAVAAFAAGCGAQQATEEEPDPWLVAEVGAVAWLPVLATQDLAVGISRIGFTLDGLAAGDEPPTVRVGLYALEGPEADRSSPRSVQYARFIPIGDSASSQAPIRAHGHANSSVSDRALPVGPGLYVVPVRLTSPGLWGLEFEITSCCAEPGTTRLRFSVRERAQAPQVGERALSTDSRTRDDVDSLAQLSTDADPEPGLYQYSIAEALELGQPLILTFATPAFCHSRTCGPVLESVKAVWRDFAPHLIGVHVEVFENLDEPQRLVESEAFVAWRLPSEPWVFVIDRDGVIRYAFEGSATEAELRSAVDWVLQDGSNSSEDEE